MADEHGIVASGLVREFKKGPRAVDGIDLAVAPRRDLRVPRPERRRQVDDGAHAHDAAAADRRDGARRPATTSSSEGPQVRAAIGAALQEAALDPAAHRPRAPAPADDAAGLPRAERARASGELCSSASGSRRRPTARCDGYSGGMKRRLDLALALVHEPRILFLDEPTTGLDLQSRSALWEEVARLAKDEGVTVFLTTQYLEEADVLADRVGIIDHGRIVAEGTPARAEGGDRAADRRGRPGRPRRQGARRRDPRALRRARAPPSQGVAVRLQHGRGRPRRDRARPRRRGPRGRAPPAAPAVARRRLPRQDRPLARRRGRGRGRTPSSRSSRRERERSSSRSVSSRGARSCARAPAGERRRRRSSSRCSCSR